MKLKARTRPLVSFRSFIIKSLVRYSLAKKKGLQSDLFHLLPLAFSTISSPPLVAFITYLLLNKSAQSKYEPVHPTQTGVLSLGRLCKGNQGNLQRKRGKKKASYLPNKINPSDSFSACKNLSEKHCFIDLSRSFGGVQLHNSTSNRDGHRERKKKLK